jgi:DNA phosphorothioation-dependent restriction protein DptG
LNRRSYRKLTAVENKLKAAGRRENMTDFLRKRQATGVVANLAEYVVMLFVAVMTGVSTLRLLGILP